MTKYPEGTKMTEESPRRLGRGLAALIGDADSDGFETMRSRNQKTVPIEFLKPNPRNPRKAFADDDLDDLTSSIKAKGIIQPILVRNSPGLPGVYEIIAGERRWRAAQKAGLHDVPVLVIDADDRTSLEIAIVENVQRADLNAIEEAMGYDNLISEFGYTQSELASTVGKSRSHVANTLRLLKLPEDVRKSVISGDITAGHARALINLPDPGTVVKRIISDNLNVRDVEKLASADSASSRSDIKPDQSNKDADTRALEQALELVLGLEVKIRHVKDGGEVKIMYKNLEQLDALCQRLKH